MVPSWDRCASDLHGDGGKGGGKGVSTEPFGIIEEGKSGLDLHAGAKLDH